MRSSTAPRLSLGLDIGSRVSKLLLAEQHPERIDIQAAGQLSIPQGTISNGVVVNPKLFGKALQEGLMEHEVPPSPTVFSIPSNLAVLRWISLPMLEGNDLREAAKFRVKKHLPFDVNLAYVEATPPEANGQEGVGTSLVIAVKKEVIDSRAEAVDCAGLIPVGAELEAQSILRIVERRLNEQSVLWRDASLTILDVGGSNTHMYVVQNQRLQFIRGVKFGANLFAQAVATTLDVSFEQAEDLLALPTTQLSPDGKLIIRTEQLAGIVNVEAELERLTREFLRLLRYFRSLHPERSYAGILDHVIICGGLVGLQGIDDYLQGALGLRVERARPFAGMIAKFKKETFQSISSRQEAFTVVMGLALSGLGKRSDTGGDKRAGREFAWARGA